MITIQVIRELAKSFPGIGESTSYGTPAMKVGKRLVLSMQQKEDAIFVILNSVEEQQQFILQDPMSFYITTTTVAILLY